MSESNSSVSSRMRVLRVYTSKLKPRFNKLNRVLPALTSNSQPNRLLALPVELRHQIYLHVIDSYGSVQHIFISDDKLTLTHMRCTLPNERHHGQTYYSTNHHCNLYDDEFREKVRNGWDILPLLLCCKQIYREFIDIIYSTISFRLPTHTANRFIATVPASSITLTRLHLSFIVYYPMYLPLQDWPQNLKSPYWLANCSHKHKEAEIEWEAFWRKFSQVKVRSLVLQIEDHQGVQVPEQLLLEPLRQMKIEKFEVVLPWPAGLETNGDFGDEVFTVIRVEGAQPWPEENVDKGCDMLPPYVPRRSLWERLIS